MPQLGELQQAFAEAIDKGTYHAATAAMEADGFALRSVALYRRLIRNNYVQVFKITYPILAQLVGDAYFSTVARGYLTHYPSTSGDLFLYGRHLPVLLQHSEAPPLLTELARLEWACHEIHHAAESTPVSQAQIQSIASIEPSRVTVRFHEATRLLSFPMPVHRVWLALQPDAPTDEVVDLPLPEEKTCVVVTRGGGRIQVTLLAKLDYVVLEALSQGADLASVERMAIQSDPEFDFQRWWATVLTLSLISGFFVKEIS